MKIRFMIMAIATLLSQCVLATTWYVSADNGIDTNDGRSWDAALKTIQKAIDTASPNDTILVTNGVYGKISVAATKEPLTIRAAGSLANCVIDAASSGRCVTIGTGITTNVFVVGFTIQKGSYSTSSRYEGGCVFGGTYENCTIANNYSACGGGAHTCVLRNCTIRDNASGFTAGAAYNCVLYNCLVKGNKIVDAGWTAGLEGCFATGCQIQNNMGTRGCARGAATGSRLTDCVVSGNTGDKVFDGCTMVRCVITNNTATSTYHGVLYGCNGSECLIAGNGGFGGTVLGGSWYNCTIIDNEAGTHYGMVYGGNYYNCIIGGSSTSTSANMLRRSSLYSCRRWNTHESDNTLTNCSVGDPGFANTTDYSLSPTSPCIDAGDISYQVTDTDLKGQGRVYNKKIDIGAIEYYPPKVSVDFNLCEGLSRTGGGALSQSIYSGTDAVSPTVAVAEGYWFQGWNKSLSNIKTNTIISALGAEVSVEDLKLTVRCVSIEEWPVYYTNDGSTPGTGSVRYTTPIQIPERGSVNIRLVGVSDSGVRTSEYSYERIAPEPPAISPASGTTFDTSLTVSMTCESEGATIHYTTDGTTPTMESTTTMQVFFL